MKQTKTNPWPLVITYVLSAVTIASFGYGIGGVDALRAGVMYAVGGLLLGLICVGLAPRFIIVIALATGLLGSILRASLAADLGSLIPKQSTLTYLRTIITICGAIGFGGGLYGGFRFTGQGLFNWVSGFMLRRSQVLDISNASLHEYTFHQLMTRFYASERMYFSLIAAAGTTVIAAVELEPRQRSLFIIFFSVLISTNLSWWFGAWLKPRLKMLGGVLKIVQQMWEVMLAFMLGYGVLVFIFACFFAAAWQHHPNTAFHGFEAAPPSFGDFVYFSVTTIATLGYGDVVPAEPLTKALCSIQVIVGLGWVTMVLSAAASLARSRVDLILPKVWAEEGAPEEPMEVPVVTTVQTTAPKRKSEAVGS